MATPDYKAAIDAAMADYNAAKAAASLAKAKVAEMAESAGAALAEGEMVSLAGNVPVLVRRNGKVLYEVIPGIKGVSS